MELNIRKLVENDWDTLVSWWMEWKYWKVAPPKDFLPDNGTGGFMVEKDGQPIVSGFLYFTNSQGVLLEWIVSNPEYKDNDRKEAVELLITTAEEFVRQSGKSYIFSIGRNASLIETHKKLGYSVDPKPSHEIIKKI
jgi:hypothetical protein|tara:strand:- start:186 stop:596 length:411 start_codon:yes stop_codon:yes gene_type:complete